MESLKDSCYNKSICSDLKQALDQFLRLHNSVHIKKIKNKKKSLIYIDAAKNTAQVLAIPSSGTYFFSQ